MLSFYFGGSFLPLSQSKVFYKFGFFDGIFGDFQEKHKFATLLKNTSALPRDFMIISCGKKTLHINNQLQKIGSLLSKSGLAILKFYFRNHD